MLRASAGPMTVGLIRSGVSSQKKTNCLFGSRLCIGLMGLCIGLMGKSNDTRQVWRIKDSDVGI